MEEYDCFESLIRERSLQLKLDGPECHCLLMTEKWKVGLFHWRGSFQWRPRDQIESNP